MNEDEKQEQQEWDEAFDDFYGALDDDDKDDLNKDDDANNDGGKDDDKGDDAKDDDKKDDDKKDDDKKDDDKKDDDAKDDAKKDDDAKGDDAKDKKGEEDEDEDDTRKVVKEAVTEFYSDREKEAAEVAQLAQEAVKMIFPKGVPDPRVDSDGDPITSPKQVEALINPQTKELFTPEEAREWFDAATKQYENNMKAANDTALHVVQVNRQMEKEMEIVKRVYGEFLEKNPEKAQKALDSYKRTLILSEDGSYIKDTPVSLLEHYNNVIQPQVEVLEELEAKEADKKKAEEEKKAEIEKQKKARDENKDLKQTQPDDVGDDEDSDWNSAFDKYYGVKTRR